MLFQEQGITIASILTAIGMAISVLVEALLPGGTMAGGSAVGKPPPKDEKGLKEWIKNKLKASASLLGRLGAKVAQALPGIIRAFISWICNRAADIVDWVLRNLWALVVDIGGYFTHIWSPSKNHIMSHHNTIHHSKYHKTLILIMLTLCLAVHCRGCRNPSIGFSRQG